MGACSKRTYPGVRRGKACSAGAATRAEQIAEFSEIDGLGHVIEKEETKEAA